jgi:spermidine synthase
LRRPPDPEDGGMKPWTLLDSAPIPGGGTMHLYQHVRDFAIRVGRDELMNSMAHGSEEALASLAHARLGSRPQRRVLVGGLGLGFTTAAALRDLGEGGRIVVAELVPAVVTWNRGPLSHLAGHPLHDPRVSVEVSDVAMVIAAARTPADTYDAILLDVDNGPRGLTRQGNNGLYTRNGLAAAFAALRPGGVLALWSAGPDRAFAELLRKTGFDVAENRVRARAPRGGPCHTIWIAGRGAGA